MNECFSPANHTFATGLPTAIFQEQHMRLFNDPVVKVNYPTKVLAKALALEMYLGNGEIYNFVTSPPDSRMLAADTWFDHLSHYTRPAVQACLTAWLESKQIQGDWRDEAFARMNLGWIRRRVLEDTDTCLCCLDKKYQADFCDGPLTNSEPEVSGGDEEHLGQDCENEIHTKNDNAIISNAASVYGSDEGAD